MANGLKATVRHAKREQPPSFLLPPPFYFPDSGHPLTSRHGPRTTTGRNYFFCYSGAEKDSPRQTWPILSAPASSRRCWLKSETFLSTTMPSYRPAWKSDSVRLREETRRRAMTAVAAAAAASPAGALLPRTAVFVLNVGVREEGRGETTGEPLTVQWLRGIRWRSSWTTTVLRFWTTSGEKLRKNPTKMLASCGS